MQFKVFGQNGRVLTRSAAILTVTALAGCSSTSTRFENLTDGLFTGSTQNQRQIISRAENQPFPGDVATAAPVNGVTPQAAPVQTAPVQRTALAPATGAPSPAPGQTPAAAAPQRTAAAQQGWNATGGTEITVRPGETIYNLSKRYGVPAEAIMKANGISDAAGLAAGRKIVIPTHAHGNVPVSAADNDPQVAKASATPAQPSPGQNAPAAPAEVAVLPQTPKLKEAEAAPQPAGASAKAEGGSDGYTVVAGDTLFGIAKKTGASAEAIKTANGLSNGFLRIGQLLKIPAAAPQQVASSQPAKIDPLPTGTAGQAAQEPGLQPAAYTPPKTGRLVEQVALNPSEAAPDATGIGRMRWPVRGRVISAFGASGGGKTNDGIDIAVPEGTPVKAAENGVVIYAGDGLKEFGNTVLVRHEDGLVTVYGHASEINVARGDTVRRGQEIARSGMSGSAQTPMLHFEVREDSAPVDPSKFLE